MAKFVTIVEKIISTPCVYNANMLAREIIILHLMCMQFLNHLLIFSLLIMMHKATCTITQLHNVSRSQRLFLKSYFDQMIPMHIDSGASCNVYHKSMFLLEQKFNNLSSALPCTERLACLCWNLQSADQKPQ